MFHNNCYIVHNEYIANYFPIVVELVMNFIQIDSDLERFDYHLKVNPRVIFSARFGDGKTFFLNKFITGYSKDRLFLTIHPVDYSVASNEDIFEYIKHDIIKQLCEIRVIDDSFIKKCTNGIINCDNVLDALAFLSKCFLLIGGEQLSATFKLIKSIKNKYTKENKSIKNFINQFSAQRGGIYENDAFTQLIREAIKSVQERKTEPKQMILVIEDLDRIDPGQLFRILNVFSAHLDSVNCKQNKFGFSNIVFVLDYQITKSIFQHFYGAESNYEGYMTKFLSSCVFNYSITRTAQQNLIDKLKEYNADCVLDVNVSRNESVFGGVRIRDLINKLSVRDVDRILNGFESAINSRIVQFGCFNISVMHSPLVCLVILLVLLDGSYSRAAIIDSISQKKIWHKFMGSMIFSVRNITLNPIIVDQKSYQISPIKNDDIVQGVNITSFRILDRTTIDNYMDVLMQTFNNVHNLVKDAKGIRYY